MKYKAEFIAQKENLRKKIEEPVQSSNRKVVCYKCGKAGHIAIRSGK